MRYLKLIKYTSFRLFVWVLSPMGLLAIFSSAASANPAIPEADKACFNMAYASNTVTGDVSVIDMRTNTVVASIPVGPNPTHPVLSPDGSKLFVASATSGEIVAIDVASQTVSERIKSGGTLPVGFAITSDAKQLVVAHLHEGEVRADTRWKPGFVRIINLETGKTGPSIPVGASPERVVLSSDGQLAYVTNLRSRTVSVVDILNNEEVDVIPVEEYPFNLLISSDGRKLYVANMFSNTISVIDTKYNKVVQTFDTGPGPNGMDFSPDESRIYVTIHNYQGSLQEIDTASGVLLRTSAPDVTGYLPGHLSLDAGGKNAYFVQPYGSDVVVVNTETFTRVGSISTNGNPNTLVVCK